jgi:hypothetical protein
MAPSDFGTAFPDPRPPRPAGAGGAEGEPIVIGPDDLVEAASAPLIVTGREAGLPQDVAAAEYGVGIPDPGRSEALFVGKARNPASRAEEEQYWPLLADEMRRRQVQIFAFEVEVADISGNVTEYVPVEVRGHSISGALPNDGTPVAVYGRRGRDGVVRTAKVLNLRTRSALTVVVEDRCFIATVAYGSIDAPQVVVLRAFRDRWLTPNPAGRLAVALYYRLSPPVARQLRRSPAARHLSRAVLDVVAAVLQLTLPRPKARR